MPVPMVRQIRLKNYKSVGHAAIRLEPLTIFVGPNGSGKSNIRDALNLVSDALQSTLEFAVRQRGGIVEVRRRSTGHPHNFGINIAARLPSGRDAAYAFEVGATKDGGFSVTREKAFVETANIGQPAKFDLQKGLWDDASSHIAVKPTISTDRLMLATLSGVPEFRELFDFLANMRFYSIDPNAFRQPQPHDTGEVLLPSGRNLAAVIRRLTQDDPAAIERIQEYMRRVVPGLDRVEHESLGPAETLAFFQWVRGAGKAWRFYAASVSDGTLRSVGVLTALFQTHPRLGAPSLVGIEEPESTIHPGAAHVLMEALLEASQRHQILLTTHSPDMIDHPDLHVDCLRIVENREGETSIAEVDSASREAVRQNLFTAGELMRQKQLAPQSNTAKSRSWQADLFRFER